MITYADIRGYCIHLERSKEREDLLKQELPKLSIPVYIVDAIYNPEAGQGTALSFQKAINRAIEEKRSCALLLEDDVKMFSQTEEYFQKAISDLPPDWDMLLGGVYSATNMTPYSDNLSKVGDFSSLHFVLVNEKCYQHWLNFKWAKPNRHIDRYLGNLSAEKKINVYITNPFVAIQHPGHSYNARGVVNYTNHLKNFNILPE